MLLGGQKPSSVLFLGRPGVGKTTVLREVSRLLADQFRRRVVIVDTSNEIAGDGDTPHPCIGLARRIQVPHRNEQHVILSFFNSHFHMYFDDFSCLDRDSTES
jgi:stage III sporulation protein SpoIIIAA